MRKRRIATTLGAAAIVIGSLQQPAAESQVHSTDTTDRGTSHEFVCADPEINAIQQSCCDRYRACMHLPLTIAGQSAADHKWFFNGNSPANIVVNPVTASRQAPVEKGFDDCLDDYLDCTTPTSKASMPNEEKN